MNDQVPPDDAQIAFMVGLGRSEGYYVRDARTGEIVACHTSVRDMTIFLERALGHRPGEESPEMMTETASGIVKRFSPFVKKGGG